MAILPRLKNLLSTVLVRLFLHSNTIAPFLVIASHCIQSLLYLVVIHKATDSIIGHSRLTTQLLIISFVSFLILRVWKGIACMTFIYPYALDHLIKDIHAGNTVAASIALTLLGILLIAEVMSNVRMDFENTSMSSQTLNSTKALHLLFFVFGVVQIRIWQNNFIPHLVCGSLFLFLFILKSFSIMLNSNVKQIQQRIYLLLSIDHFIILGSLYFQPPLIFYYLLPLLLSQLIYQVYEIRHKAPSLDELHSQEEYFRLAFTICKYFHAKEFSQSLQYQIQRFTRDNNVEYQGNHERLNDIYQKLVTILERIKSFENYLLIAQIYLHLHYRLLKTRHAIEVLKIHAGGNWIKKILIYRLEQMLQQKYYVSKGKISFDHYEQYQKSDDFRTLLMKSSIHFINFWDYSRKAQILPSKLREMADRVVDYQTKIKKTYETFQPKCVAVSLLYVTYLFEVTRDVKEARRILQYLSFNESKFIDLAINQKIFLQLDLEKDPLKITKIGHNLSLLLGYERKELENQNISALLPDFYRKMHQNIVAEFLEEQFEKLHLYHKKSIIKNKFNYYQECNLVLRLHYNFGQNLFLQGFIQVKDNPSYIWTNYLFANQMEQIIQTSESLEYLAPTFSKKHKLSQLFTSFVDMKKSNFAQADEYYPLLVFNMEEDEITYFVRKEPKKLDLREVKNSKMREIVQSLKAIPFDLSFVKVYFKAGQELLSNVWSKEYSIIGGLCILLMVGSIVSQTFFYLLMNNKQDRQKTMLNETSDIVYYINNYTQIALFTNYFDMHRQINYTNNFTAMGFLQNDTLILQRLNERLKEYLQDVVTINSATLSGVTYDMSMYQIAVQYMGNAFLLQQFKDDEVTLDLATINFRKSIYQLIRNLYKVRTFYERNIEQTPEDNLNLNITLIIVIGVFFLIILILLVRIEHKIRLDEHETLTLICNTKYQDDYIDYSKHFISKITKEEVQIARMEHFTGTKASTFKKEQTSFAPDVTIKATDRNNKPPMSMSSRELSNRSLMESGSNLDLFLQTKASSKVQQKEAVALRSIQLPLSPRKKTVLFVVFLLIVAIMALLTLNLVKNGMINVIKEKVSVDNIFRLHSQGTFTDYSVTNMSRKILNFLNYVNLRLGANDYGSASTYKVKDSDFTRAQVQIVFDETQLTEFEPFKYQLTNLKYHYLCSYVDCDPRFAPEIDIIYTKTIQKIFTMANTFIDTLEPLSTEQVRSQLSTNTTMKYRLDLIYYTEIVIRRALTSMLDTYNVCYKIYSDRLLFNKSVQMGIAVALTALGLILLILLLFFIHRNQKYLQSIAEIFKIDSYDEDELLKEDDLKLNKEKPLV